MQGHLKEKRLRVVRWLDGTGQSRCRGAGVRYTFGRSTAVSLAVGCDSGCPATDDGSEQTVDPGRCWAYARPRGRLVETTSLACSRPWPGRA
jgi:hypothetical protein